jgi:hypothetical protein
MYGLSDITGKGEKGGSELDKFKYNLGRSVVQSAHASIASNRPKPKFQTDDADWGLVQKAQACEQAVKGVFAANNMYSLGGEAFVDAAVTSIGCVQVFGEEGRVKIERCYPGEIVVDVREGYYGSPRTIYRVKIVDRTALEERFDTKIEGDTADASLLKFFNWIDYDATLDQVVTVEAWRLGAKKDADGKRNGKHVICTSGRTLVEEPYTRERFPLVFFRWAKRQIGFYGTGIIEELRGHQRALNYLHLKLADMIHNNSRSTLAIPQGSKGAKVNAEHVTNDPATMLEIPFGASPPFQITANAVPSEIFAWRREIIEDGYAQEGVAQLMATGAVPPGLSGIAVREYEDAGSRRFRTVVQAYEGFFVEVARVVVDELRELAESGEAESVSTVIRKGSRAKVELIDWAKVNLEDHLFTLETTPASSLPDSTAGRSQTVLDWLNAGLCTQHEAKALLDHPDLERFKSLDLASYEVVLDTIERIVEDGEYYPPEPTDDLELALKLATQSYNKFRLRKVPAKNLDLLLEYLDDVRALTQLAQQGAQQAAAPAAVPPSMPGQAMAQGMPQPALAA